MRNMSFALTTGQIIDGSKTVTRRLGWLTLKPGDRVQPVLKCMGLRRGEHLQLLRAPLLVLGVRREPLLAMTQDLDYGLLECAREGFGDHPVYRWPSEFVAMFCASHRGCTPQTIVTRIEFSPECTAECTAERPEDACPCPQRSASPLPQALPARSVVPCR